MICAWMIMSRFVNCVKYFGVFSHSFFVLLQLLKEHGVVAIVRVCEKNYSEKSIVAAGIAFYVSYCISRSCSQGLCYVTIMFSLKNFLLPCHKIHIPVCYFRISFAHCFCI